MTNQRFELTEDLIKLLRRSYVSRGLSDVEYGASEINGKRPYGNSDVERDIAEILGWEVDDAGPTDEQEKKAREIHEQTPTALQIVLATGEFVPGLYEASAYGVNWRRVQ